MLFRLKANSISKEIYNALIGSMQLMANANVKSIREFHGGPFSASVLDANLKIVTVECNSVLLDTDPSRHAEIVAISRACKKLAKLFLDDCLLFSSHMPCLMCHHGIKWAKIRTVYTLFSYEDTKNIFGIAGDDSFVSDLKLESDFQTYDPNLQIYLLEDEALRDKYLEIVLPVWNEYKNKIRYDI